jgi:hypothetical protein
MKTVISTPVGCAALAVPSWWQSRSSGAAQAIVLAAVVATLSCIAEPAAAQFIQQGNKLVGMGGSSSEQGYSVRLSADGNTALVGAPNDGAQLGAAWVFTRSGGAWSQQGTKLVGNGAAGAISQQGYAVALSADGNTALLGGFSDNTYIGAVWVFTRSNGVWSPQGNKLTGNDAVGGQIGVRQGFSVALSADGNTALVGGPYDNTYIGAVWVFTRTGGVWSQQGAKLVASDYGTVTCASNYPPNEPCPYQGYSVALSADGNTALVGGSGDSSHTGAAWVFTRSAGQWTQQGSKLVGSGGVNGIYGSQQGTSVALSADGNTAMVGGQYDNNGAGAVWVFTRSGGMWSPQGAKLVGSSAVNGQFGSNQGNAVALSGDGNTAVVGGFNDNSGVGAWWIYTRTGGTWSQNGFRRDGIGAVGAAQQGTSVALSADGNTLLEGGYADNSAAGAAWVFRKTVPTNTHDANDDGYSDIAWRDAGGDLALWLMNGATVSSSGGIGTVPTTWSLVGQRDFNGDGIADLLWRDTSGNTAMWFMNGTTVASTAGVGNIANTWSVVATADFNGDGIGDILWRDSLGNTSIWIMNGAAVSSSGGLGNIPTTWAVAGTGDFNRDGFADILWRDNQGNTSPWFMNGTTVSSTRSVGNIPTSWSVVGIGDFNGDGVSDIVWRDSSGNTSIWLMNGASVLSAGALGVVPTTWSIAQTGDYDGNGMSDLLWRDGSGNTSIWFMNGTTVASTGNIGNIPTNWTVQSVNAE